MTILESFGFDLTPDLKRLLISYFIASFLLSVSCIWLCLGLSYLFNDLKPCCNALNSPDFTFSSSFLHSTHPGMTHNWWLMNFSLASSPRFPVSKADSFNLLIISFHSSIHFAIFCAYNPRFFLAVHNLLHLLTFNSFQDSHQVLYQTDCKHLQSDGVNGFWIIPVLQWYQTLSCTFCHHKMNLKKWYHFYIIPIQVQ